MKKNLNESPEPSREELASFEQTNKNAEAHTEYASGLIPLLWLGIPFILVVLYGLLT